MNRQEPYRSMALSSSYMEENLGSNTSPLLNIVRT